MKKKKILINIILIIIACYGAYNINKRIEKEHLKELKKSIIQKIENKESIDITINKTKLDWENLNTFKTKAIGITDKQSLKWFNLKTPVEIRLYNSFKITDTRIVSLKIKRVKGMFFEEDTLFEKKESILLRKEYEEKNKDSNLRN